MKSKLKRTLSLLLCIVMIAGFVPVMEATAKTVSYIYDLGYDMHSHGNKIELDYADTNDSWSYYTKYGDGILSKRYRVGSGYPYDEYLRITDGSWYAAKIKVPEAGTYTPTIIAFKNTDTSSEAKIYLIDKATAEELYASPDANSYKSFADKENSGSLNGKAATKEGHGTIAGNAMTFAEGENYIVFYNPEVSSAANYFYIASLTLTKEVTDPEPEPELPFAERAELTLATNETMPATYVKITSAKAYDNTGAEIDFSKATVTYSSDNKAVATVEENGLIRARTSGEANIILSVTYNGKTATASQKLTVKDLPPQGALPDVIGAYIKGNFLHIGEKTVITVTDMDGAPLGGGVNYTYSVPDDGVVSEKDGELTALKMGRTTVKVTAELDGEVRETECIVAVVGKNLLTREYAHGEFENGIYLSDNSSSFTKKGSLWKATRNNTTDNFDFELQRNVVSDITGNLTNVAKFTSKALGSTNRIRFQGSRLEYKKASDQRGYIVGNENKLYEFSGYIKGENVGTLPKASIRLVHYNGLEDVSVSLKSYYAATWDGKTGDQDWTFFNVPPVILSYSYRENYGMHPDVWFSSVSEGAVLYAAHLSAHEVIFDRAELALSDPKAELKNNTSVSTVLSLYSNTGNVITRGSTDVPLDVVYSSSDDDIATVSPDGKITPVSNGKCEIYADVTVCGVKKRAVLKLELSGLETALYTVRASADNSELAPGGNTRISYELFNNDGTAFEGEHSVYYESTNAAVAVVSQDGTVTAKKAGRADVYVWVNGNGKIAKGTVLVTVTDETPLASVKIDGRSIVEKGFGIKLKAIAYTESGLEADSEKYRVTFELADEASADVISITPDGTVSGKEEGSASVIVTAELDGKSVKSEPYEVRVSPASPKSKIYKFNGYSDYAHNATLEGNGWEIDVEKTATLVGSVKSTRLYVYPQGMFSRIKASGNTREADTALNIRVDYDGWYEIDFVGMTMEDGTSRGNFYLDEIFIGDYCFYLEGGDARVSGLPKSLNTVYLTKGDHSLIIRSMENVGNGYQYPVTLKLRYLETSSGMESVAIDCEKSELAVGENAAISAKAIMAGGREYVFGPKHGGAADTESYVTLESSEPEILEIKDGRAYAKAPGEATVTAKAKIGDAESEESIKVIVNEEYLSEITFPQETYNVYMGTPVPVGLKAYLSDGEEIAAESLTVAYESGNAGVAVVENEKLVGISEGSTEIKVTVSLGNIQITEVINVNVIRDGFACASVSAITQVIKSKTGETALSVKAFNGIGQELDASAAQIEYKSSDDAIASVDGKGRVIAGRAGVAEITAEVTLGTVTHTASIDISVRDGKVKPTYYTYEERANALENAQKYDWAKKQAKAAAELGDYYLTVYETIYNFIPAHTLPRSEAFVDRDHPYIGCCMYCGTNCQMEYGTLVFPVDMINRPWKIQCPDCKRLFPSNDFDSFYKNGLDEHGEFDYTLAREENGILCGRGERVNGEYVVFDWAKDNPYGYGDPNGNLYNETYKELYTSGLNPLEKTPITQGWLDEDYKVGGDSGVPTMGHFWGVDDGFGYKTGREWTAGEEDTYCYIGRLNYFGLWNRAEAEIYEALNALRDAYLYTGEKKYGIAGAALLDRIADLYPDYDFETDNVGMSNMPKGGDDSSGQGKIHGRIYENFLIQAFARAYDAFFDVYDEPELIKFISGYAEKWNLDNKKTNGELLRQNAEENLLMEAYRATLSGQVKGNYGMVQNSMAMVAVVLDREPDSQEIIDFMMRDGITTRSLSTGLGMRAGIVNELDRDGYMHESSLGYNTMTTGHFVNLADTLASWDKVRKEDNLAENPKLYKTLLQGADMIVTGTRQPAIGDGTASFGGTELQIDVDGCLLGFKESGNPLFAQLIYLAKKGDIEGIHYDIFTKDPESPQTAIKEVIEEYGEFPASESTITTGYGLAVLRDGVKYDDVASATKTNTMRDWWMYFGHKSTTHGQADALNLGIDAFGIEMGPDPGYRTTKLGGSPRAMWIEGTSAHNTVVVNDRRQTLYIPTGSPLHFDDSGAVKVMDVDLPEAYSGITDTYRRTVVSVDIDDSVSYALDFFRIVGGDEHVYSFHSMSNESVVTGVNLVKQPGGSYAGADVPIAEVDMNSGYNCFEQVERAADPETGEFSVDFKVLDWYKKLDSKRNIHLKLTQLNDFELSEVARAKGRPTEKGGNPELIDYILARRSGKDLDTLFTTVLEPYEDESKIKEMRRVAAVRCDGGKAYTDEPIAAIRVELTNGRVDYVVYATNKDATYMIDDLFEFRGFVGVYSVSATDSADVVRTYLHDGKTLGTETVEEFAAVTGEIVNFTKTFEFENNIEVTLEETVDPSEFVGRMIVIDNDGVENGSYIIKSAEKKGDNVILSTGDVSFIRSLTTEGEYEFNIKEGQAFSIPLTHTTDASPQISVSGTFTTSAGSSIRIPLSVTSDREYTLIGTTLPRGMSLNSENGVLTWKPDASQVGENHVAVTVDNGVLSDTVHFIVTVYGNTTGGSSENNAGNDAGTTEPVTPPAGGGGGGGGGGAAPTDKPEDIIETDKTDTSGESGENEGNTDNTGTENNSLRFTDLENYAWASDAINALAADGVIRGTSETTFAPANNITRADFALLLVRAFKLTSDNTENFADVSASDYFASELAIARNNGIISGIGDNKFAPRNTITRQDMMVIVYRALQKQDVGFGIYDEPQYPDFANVAPYAKDAVSALIGAGLVNGKSGNIAPTDYTTRAEVAVLIKRILDYAKQ